MGIENRKPKAVDSARFRDDREALSRMGKKGAEQRMKHLKEKQQAEEADAQERAEIIRQDLAERARLEPISEEGDVLPPKE